MHDKALSVFSQPLIREICPTGLAKEIIDRFVTDFLGQEDFSKKIFNMSHWSPKYVSTCQVLFP